LTIYIGSLETRRKRATFDLVSICDTSIDGSSVCSSRALKEEGDIEDSVKIAIQGCMIGRCQLYSGGCHGFRVSALSGGPAE
jgi:hypothetical protein